tara:strand:- start:1101 stop:1568 length:468 start_codon:yes stop_codon:yes gene_type:complete
MKAIIKVYLEHKEDVNREIQIEYQKNLEDLRNAIINYFDLNKLEIGSFYLTNDNFDLLEEIPCFPMDEKSKVTKDFSIDSLLTKDSNKLIYIHDFLEMWHFLIELIDVDYNSESDLKLLSKIGKMPKKNQELRFETENNSNSDIDYNENYCDEYY